MTEYYTFDDVLIVPKFSNVKSRKDVNLKTNFLDMSLPIISSNMDTVTGPEMCIAMRKNGGIGCLHRFWSIADNIAAFMAAGPNTIVSFGLGETEQQRVTQLHEAGAKFFCLDVAHGAQQTVVDQTQWFKTHYKDSFLVVGNFASVTSWVQFKERCEYLPDAIKVGIGNGSACTTRIKTGIGAPQLSCLRSFQDYDGKVLDNVKLISDGGVKTPGDVAKALAAGADAVMTGNMLAGTSESPGEYKGHLLNNTAYKEYRGSASKVSYEVQGKDADWRAAEGESFMVPYKGPVIDVLKDIEGGLRSSLTYVGASNLTEFKQLANFIRISNNSKIEGQANGKI